MDAEVRLGRWTMTRAALGVVIAACAFVAVTVVWVILDRRTPGGGDPAHHLLTAMQIGDYLRSADLGSIADVGPDGFGQFYPPLVSLVGGVAYAFDLNAQDWGQVALNLVFLPMLAAGTYLAGRRVYGPTAGFLAAVFALGTPIVLSMFHVFLLDGPLAGAVAAALAALLATERFAERRASALAGALIGLAMLVKTIGPLYLAGPVAVMLLAGGWRHWRNVAIAGIAFLVVAGPYYAIHLGDVFQVGEQATVGNDVGLTGAAGDQDARISFDNFTWYAWAAINEQFFVPLVALFVTGAVLSVRELRTRPGIAELLAGVALTPIALAIVFSIRDPRYTVPLVAFVAVLGTGWMTTVARPVWRRIGIAVLSLAVTANVAVSLVGSIPVIRLEPPGTNFEFGVDPGSFTILDDTGYWVGPPETDPFWHDLFEAAEREGIETMRLITYQQPLFWGADYRSLHAFGVDYGIREVSNGPRPIEEAELRLQIWDNDDYFIGELGRPEPCARIAEGAGLLTGEPETVSVLVERRGPQGFERWCEF